jgi:hypothetical protein
MTCKVDQQVPFFDRIFAVLRSFGECLVTPTRKGIEPSLRDVDGVVSELGL